MRRGEMVSWYGGHGYEHGYGYGYEHGYGYGGNVKLS
jgi:hypothetical protein